MTPRDTPRSADRAEAPPVPIRRRLLVYSIVLAGLALSTYGGYRAFQSYLAENFAPREPAVPFTLAEQAQRQVDTARQEGRVTLANETMEVASPDRRVVGLEPVADGIIDGAYGVDPLVVQTGARRADFALSIRGPSGEVLWSLEESLDLERPESIGWHPFRFALPEGWEGDLEVVFERRAVEMPAATAAQLEVEPDRLLFWARPRIRPRRLSDRPNVVFVSIDTLRADHLSYAGYERPTSPNLDRLVEEGVAFLSCFSPAPWTTPSHFSMLTGLWPHRHGADLPYQNLVRGWDRDRSTLADHLRRAGYTTAAFTGAGPMSASFGLDDGFDLYAESRTDNVAHVTESAQDWLRVHADRSFFLFVHTYEPHEPYLDDYFVTREGIDESAEWESRVARYDGDIRRADQYLGRLFDDLRAHGLWDSTLVVVTSDHGEELDQRLDQADWKPHGHGHSLYDELLRVPLIFSGGAVRPANRRITTQVRSIDIAPTVLDYAGLEAPPEIDGRSLRPLIRGDDATPRVLLAEATTYGTERVAVRTPEHKLIRRVGLGQLEAESGSDFPLTPKEELYDLRSDPGERENLAARDEAGLRRLRRLLERQQGEEAPRLETESLEDDVRLKQELEALGYVD